LPTHARVDAIATRRNSGTPGGKQGEQGNEDVGSIHKRAVVRLTLFRMAASSSTVDGMITSCNGWRGIRPDPC
jgi:hypothetical protein